MRLRELLPGFFLIRADTDVVVCPCGSRDVEPSYAPKGLFCVWYHPEQDKPYTTLGQVTT